MKSISNIRTYGGICLAVSFWGVSFLWTDQLLQLGFPLYSLIFIRLLIAAIALLVSLGLMRKLQRPKKKDLKWFVLMALFEPFLYFVGETNGIKVSGSPTISSVIIATIPLFTMAAGYSIYKENLTKVNIIGILISVFGVTLAVLDNNFNMSVNPLGVALLFLAVFTAVGYSLVIRRLTDTYSSFTIVSIQNVLGALFFLPLFLLESKEFSAFHFTWETVYPLVMLALLPSCVSFLLYVRTIKTLGVSKTNMFTTLTPISTMILALAMGQEDLSHQKIIGSLIVVAGLLLSQRVPAKS